MKEDDSKGPQNDLLMESTLTKESSFFDDSFSCDSDDNES